MVKVTPNSGRTTLTSESDATINSKMLDQLLGMADRYRGEGHVRQAMEMYWALVDQHAGTAQAKSARLGLMGQAQTYEQQGARHVARAIYERLLA
jgi:hypothetical protein